MKAVDLVGHVLSAQFAEEDRAPNLVYFLLARFNVEAERDEGGSK
jgi:hypothetical protein